MWIKICGVTRPEDAEAVVTAGADAVGLNFYPQSKRYIEPDKAVELRRVVGDALDVVGVFVNSSAEDAAEITQRVGLTAVQFHGDESAELVARFCRLSPDTAVIRAFRIGAEGTAAMFRSLEELTAAGADLAAVLTDALVVGEYGGTGRQIDPTLLQDRPEDCPRLILAGGLTPQTVAAACEKVRPWGADTAGGVESSPGIKSSEKIRQFVAAVRSSGQQSRVRLRDPIE